MRRSLILLLLLSAVPTLPAQQKPASATVQLPPKPLLPQSFAGWTAVAPPQASNTAPAAQQAALAEFGFRRIATASYRNGTRTLAIQAEQFADATGAYGAFSNFGCTTECRVVAIGAGALTNGAHTSFWNGDTFVSTNATDAPASLNADLQSLAKSLPVPTGGAAQPPSLPDYLPKPGLDPSHIRYALGPIAFAESQSPLSGKLDFNTGAEALVARYGSGTLTLVEYPTPQMAIAQQKNFASALNLQPRKDLPQGLLSAGDGSQMIVAWRTGPILALTSGISQAEAIRLAREIHYEAEVTLDKPQGYVSEAWRAAHLYLGIAALSGILCGSAIFLGLFFGGARAIIRVMRGKSASAVEDTEFISLNLAPGPLPPDKPQD
jgi:hypothetical protein